MHSDYITFLHIKENSYKNKNAKDKVINVFIIYVTSEKLFPSYIKKFYKSACKREM